MYHMPIKDSAKKELRKSKKRMAFNVSQKRSIKDTIKKIRKSLDSQKIDEAQKLAEKIVKMLDKAAKQNVIHENAAARKKSRVYKAIKKASTKK